MSKESLYPWDDVPDVDETQISIVINGEMVSMPTNEAVRVYERLHQLLGETDE